MFSSKTDFEMALTNNTCRSQRIHFIAKHLFHLIVFYVSHKFWLGLTAFKWFCPHIILKIVSKGVKMFSLHDYVIVMISMESGRRSTKILSQICRVAQYVIPVCISWLSMLQEKTQNYTKKYNNLIIFDRKFIRCERMLEKAISKFMLSKSVNCFAVITSKT